MEQPRATKHDYAGTYGNCRRRCGTGELIYGGKKTKKRKTKDDKRKHPRYPVGLAMDIHAKGHSVQKCRGTITDLSLGGMMLKTSTELKLGGMIYLKINVPLEVRGEIRHLKSGSAGGYHRYGIRFHKIGFEGGTSEARSKKFISAKFSRVDNG